MKDTKKGILSIVCLMVLLLLPGLSKAEEEKARVIEEKVNIRLKQAYQIYQPIAGPKSGLSLRLLGGINYLLAKDINDGVQGWGDYWADSATLSGYSVEGEAKPIRFGYDFQGDIIINFTPQFGIGFGGGYIQGSKTSEISFANSTEGNSTNKPKISAIPVRVGLFFNLPMNQTTNFVFNIGGGYYFAKYSYNWRAEENGDWMDLEQSATARGFGFHGGIGFEFNLAPNMAFVLEGQGRYAKIGGFEGTIDRSTSWGDPEKEEGKLYYGEVTDMGKKYPFVFIFEEIPSDPDISEAREAKVDFSGFTMVAGIIIRF